MEESVVYQDIYQKGEQRGLRNALEQGERKVALRLLELQAGKLSLKLRRQIGQLALEQVEALCDVLLKFKSKDDLARWLEQNTPAQ